MAQIAKLKLLLFSAFGPAIAILLLLFFAAYAVLGSSGILAWGDYSRQLRAAHATLAQVQQDQRELKNRVEALDPRRVDPDLADELIRRQLGVVRQDEIIIPLN